MVNNFMQHKISLTQDGNHFSVIANDRLIIRTSDKSIALYYYKQMIESGAEMIEPAPSQLRK